MMTPVLSSWRSTRWSGGRETRPSTDTENGDTPGVVVRPPRLFLAAFGVGLALDRLAPLPFDPLLSVGVRGIAGGGFVLAGLGIGVAGIRNFARASTPVRTIEPTRTLVTTGVHAWTRNPIYVGLFVLYGGMALLTASLWALVLLLPLTLTMRYGVVAREEAYLERRFGDTYRGYKVQVRRWL